MKGAASRSRRRNWLKCRGFQFFCFLEGESGVLLVKHGVLGLRGAGREGEALPPRARGRFGHPQRRSGAPASQIEEVQQEKCGIDAPQGAIRIEEGTGG